LLPRTKPSNQEVLDSTTSKNSSIFGTGKPRDITKPEIKQLEERLEKSLILSRQQATEISEAAAQTNLDTSSSSNIDELNTKNNISRSNDYV
jgi:hypothetical protein